MWYIYLGVIVLILILGRKWIINLFSSTKLIKNDPNPSMPDPDPKPDIPDPDPKPNDPKESDTIFAVNDNGNFDLANASGKILNIGFGPNPKVYINLLDRAEKDVDRIETEKGVTFNKKVDMHTYQIGGKSYNVDFTRLTV